MELASSNQTWLAGKWVNAGLDGRIIYQHKMKNETQGCYGTFLWTTVDGKHPAPPCAPSWMVEILSWDKPPIN